MKNTWLSFLRVLGVTALAALGMASTIGTGGGGGDDSLPFPLWIPTDIVVADLDNDGRQDVVTLARLSTSMSHDEGRIMVYRQSGQGVFSMPITYTVGEYPWQLVTCDINGDALPDLLVTDPDREEVRLLLQNPNNPGNFLPARLIASGMHVYNAAVGDFNNDRTPDIAAADSLSGSSRLVILYQDPAQRGLFLPGIDFMVPGTSSSHAGADDLDGDGLTDLFAWVALPGSGRVPNGVFAISRQHANGTLGQAITLAPQTGLNMRHLAVTDYNDDGANDIIAFFTPYSVAYNAKLTVMLQTQASGTFAAPVDTSLAGIKGIDDAVVADFNNDGRPDCAVVGYFPEGSPSTVRSRLNLFIQSGDGALALAAVYAMPIAVSRVAAGDIDNDGLIDLVVLGGDNEAMALLQSRAAVGTFHDPQPI